HLFVYHEHLRVKPKDYEGWLKQAYEVVRTFYATAPPTPNEAPPQRLFSPGATAGTAAPPP
ncbi:MAG TPA: hypothetical protein VK610_06465, partial [Rhodothermales bacterium]|nr:hypothetical protein [Rhodothermales bacterium]